jgi:Flp pilus assembly protein TadB
MTAVVAVLAGLAVLAWRSAPSARIRLSRLRLAPPGGRAVALADRGPPPPETPGNTGPVEVRGRRLVVAVLAGLSAGFLVGGPAGLGVGFAVVVGVDQFLGRLEPRAVRRRRERVLADLPLAADLLSACLRAGLSPAPAVDAIAFGMSGPLADEFAHVATAIRLGADAKVAWSRFLDDDQLAAFGRAMVRVWDTGAPLADALDRLSEDARQRRRSEADRRAKAVGVKAAAPLGLCFLPAFILVGVVPLVAGAVGGLLP